MDRVPSSLAFEYHRHIVNESMETQQKAASSTRTFAVQLAKARNTMHRRANISKGGVESSNEEEGEQPLSNAMHQKEWRDKGCDMCKLFGCPKGYDEAKECDIFDTPTFERVQKIKAMEKYMTKVDKYRKDEKLTALNYEAMQSGTHKVDKEARVENRLPEVHRQHRTRSRGDFRGEWCDWQQLENEST